MSRPLHTQQSQHTSHTQHTDMTALDDTISWLSTQKETANRRKGNVAGAGTNTSKSSGMSIWWIIGGIAIVLIIIFAVIYIFGSNKSDVGTGAGAITNALQHVTGAVANGIIPEGNVIFMEVGTKNEVSRENVLAGDYKIVN